MKLDEKSDHLLKCHIQDIDNKTDSCIVFIEKLSEKRSVAIDQIHMFNAYESPRHFNRWYDKGYLDACENEKRVDHFDSYTDRKYSTATDYDDNSNDAIFKACNLEPYTNLMNFHPAHPFQLIALPVEFNPPPPVNMSSINGGKSQKNRILGASGPMVVVTPAANSKGAQATLPVGVSPNAIDENVYTSKHGKEMKVTPKSQPAPPSNPVVAPPHPSQSHPAQQKQQAMQSSQQPSSQTATEYPAQIVQESAVDPNVGVQSTPQGYMYVQTNPSMYAYAQPMQSEYSDQVIYGYPADMMQNYYAVAQNGVYQAPGAATPQAYAAAASPNSMYQCPMPVNAWSSYNSPMNQGLYLHLNSFDIVTIACQQYSPNKIMQFFPRIFSRLCCTPTRAICSNAFTNTDKTPILTTRAITIGRSNQF